ncbi:GH1 family beta-glucosidase [Aquabacterium humicola]|uniref:GH1 family beta-glucosidase n=1 Tax=Aquabacterium humicola TaxID=3237377 RepID=UPI00254311CE|nr:GH1 family beta-glucosidase [Rubrivivax pictus]
MPDTVFPPGFLWGAATSAYQVEGSPLADGAGISNWHRFAHTPGRIAGGDTGDIACDHYRRMPEDVALMRTLGLNAYRFSVAWSRVLPEGRGRLNAAGLGFYERLVDQLLGAGITPMLTLHHWDLPAALDDRGGWLNPDSADWFADYAALVGRALGDRVALWTTLNEPWVIADGGFMHGVLAPGHRSAWEAALVAQRLLCAHGRGVQALRAECSGPQHRIGLVVNIEPKRAASDHPADRAACERAHAYMNRQYLDPVLRGERPAELAALFGPAWPACSDEDIALMRTPIDWVGINYYTRGVMAHDETTWPLQARHVRQPGATYTETGWEVHARALTETLLWVRERYGDIPQYVTENGAAFYDPPVAGPDGIADPLRLQYLRDHLGAVADAIRAGVDLRGYFAWSLLDNLEWAHGYAKRFGIVHVDFATGRRTPKASARWYAKAIARHGAGL